MLGGLPASGKTTIARVVARRTGAAHVRVDTVEQAIVDSGLTGHQVGVAGYAVAYAVAADQLDLGHVVVADTVNPVEQTRAAWRTVAASRGLPLLEVEVVCTDARVHRERAMTRPGDIANLPPPTWEDITAREYAAWAPDLRLDTLGLAPDEAAAVIIQTVPWLTTEGAGRHE